MSTWNLTEKQAALLAAIPRVKPWKSQAQLAEATSLDEGYVSKTLRRFARAGLATYERTQDAEDPQTHYKLWRRK